MLFRSSLTLLLVTNVSGFFVAPAPRPFVSRHVSLSDPSTASDVEPSNNDKAENLAEAVASDDSTSKSTEKGDRHTLYVGNLPYGMSLEEVRTMFAEHVPIKYINLPRNEETGEIKGFAFIDVESADDIPKAVDALNGVQVGDRPLRVSKVLEKNQIRSKKQGQRDDKNKLFVGNLPFKATPEDLKEAFSQFGEILDVFIPRDSIGEPRGFAFVTCAEADVEAVRQGANGVEFMGRSLSVNLPLAPGEKTEKREKTDKPRRRKLYVGNLAFFTSEETLTEVFEEFGQVYDCYIPQDPERGGSRGFGFITMEEAAAIEAIDALDGCELEGRIIAVNEAQIRRKNSREYQKNRDDNNDDDEDNLDV
eukprot:CAMPEP_0170232902 /NCGR_PEP_ID=MMETSP0116_2-20130129/16193_1 /TAXON_ID=400756 /ORGANISM="Durinskia baltica, Strain CSIRO CS-38" /LENGTH=363 /DNA_ID=CAMNT_0010483689 /DNA_START=119 /DNA_END=1210 /DNA_ORIENTATION=+